MNINQKNYALTLCLLLLGFFTIAQNKTISPDYSSLIEKYRNILQEEIRKNNIAGLSVALVDGDSLVWCEGFGFYNSQNRNQVTGHTPFNIGSISKTFTGLAVMQLQEDKKLNIDQPYKKYVPEFSMHSNYGSIDSIKIRDILTHHAGIPDYVKDKFAVKPPYFTKVLDVVNNDYATFAPGTVFSYSNAGFSILGNLIENTSGQSYYDFVRKRILDPLEMSESGFVKDDKVPLSVRLGYNLKGEECTELAIFDAPAGCIYSTAHDMAKYVRAFLNWGKYEGKQVFDSLTQVNMMQIQNRDVFLDFGMSYGLAWKTYYTDGGLSIQHDGGTMYHRAEVSISPLAGVGVVMLSNSSSGKPLLHVDYDLMNEAIQLKGYKKKPVSEPNLKNTKHPGHNFTFVPEPARNMIFRKLDGSEVEKYSGWYGSFGVLCKVTSGDNVLAVNLNRNEFFLFPVENDLFVPAGKNSRDTVNPKNRFYFEEYNGEIILVQIDEYGNHSIIGKKLDVKPLSKTWEGRLGNYINDGDKVFQMFSDFSLMTIEGVLCLSAQFNMEMPGVNDHTVIAPLDIIDDKKAKISGFGRFSGQVMQFDQSEMRFMGFSLVKE